jgi:predicted enzyme related to lactoylglutathione lyase
MDKNSNSLNWFEIPALDFERAKKFYEAYLPQNWSPFPK